MKPLQHARITAHRYGGQWQDWITFHDWLDHSKLFFSGMQHRMFLHSDFGEWLALHLFGERIEAGDGTVIPTADLFRDHQLEDLGRIVPLSEWLQEADPVRWSHRRNPPRSLNMVRDSPIEGLSTKWGGVPADFQALVDLFDKPREFAPDFPSVAEMITHNSFGTFLAEELFGPVITLTSRARLGRGPQFISTRSAAEDLVYARIGSIPPAGHLAARVRLRRWMCGAGVRAALKSRLINERKARRAKFNKT